MRKRTLILMQKIILLLSAVIVLVSLSSDYAAGAEGHKTEQTKGKVVLGADLWCPYNCSPSTDKPGYVIEMAKSIFEKAGYQFEYITMPWEQAKADALHGKIDGAICMDKNEGLATEKKEDPSQKLKFQYSAAEVAVNTSCFYVLRDNPWKFNPQQPDTSLTELDGKVGAGRDYGFNLSDKLSEKNMLVEVGGDHPCRGLLMMLLAGKIKATIEDRSVMQYMAFKLGMLHRIKEAGLAEEPMPLYIGFCSDCRELADTFSQGVDELRASGKLKEILSKYGIADWKKNK